MINVAPGDEVASLATIDMGTTNGNGKQSPLAGMEDDDAPVETEEAPASGAAKKPSRKPTPIKGRNPSPKGKPRR